MHGDICTLKAHFAQLRECLQVHSDTATVTVVCSRHLHSDIGTNTVDISPLQHLLHTQGCSPCAILTLPAPFQLHKPFPLSTPPNYPLNYLTVMKGVCPRESHALDPALLRLPPFHNPSPNSSLIPPRAANCFNPKNFKTNH